VFKVGGFRLEKFLDKKKFLDYHILELAKSGKLSVGVEWINR